MMRRLLLLAIIGMVLGGVLGFAGTWASHRSENGSHHYGEDCWSTLLALPALPGNIITWRAHGAYDWGVDEDWNYRVPITIWNGVFWSVIFVVIGAIKSWWIMNRSPNSKGR